MPKMIFEGSQELKIHSDDEGLIIELSGNSTKIPMNEAIHLSGWITHQLVEIKQKQRQRLPKWKQLLTI